MEEALFPASSLSSMRFYQKAAVSGEIAVTQASQCSSLEQLRGRRMELKGLELMLHMLEPWMQSLVPHGSQDF